MRCNVRIVPVGNPSRRVIDFLLRYLKDSDLEAETYLSEPLHPVEFAYNPARRQYLSTAILRALLGINRVDGERVLGVTELDLYVPGLNFVFGEALYTGAAAVISTYRLESMPIIFGATIESRVAKEAIHELGHTFGLTHCSRRSCVMSFSNSVFETDIKGERFCNECKGKLQV
ncbi:MAG: archaemetzincin family Zn-dependent metalloprotease [Candidatus Bathyarchaeia archaeon]|nr:archaemetzincin family Zn-dependent metalloprotease [Candidatus Bathyarchaeota archaeon]